jgi:hypothetical protein
MLSARTVSRDLAIMYHVSTEAGRLVSGALR